MGVYSFICLLCSILLVILITVSLLHSLSSRTLAVFLAILINFLAALPFYPLLQLNSLVPLAIFPGGATSLFMMQSLVMRRKALSLIIQGMWYSVISTLIYITLCYLIVWLREDLLNVMDRVGYQYRV